jgi:general stress protein 26
MKNSIDQRQAEENHEDLRGTAAIRKMRELVEKAKNCFFCTSGSGSARPMNVRQVDRSGNLWFLSADDSHKNDELRRDPRVRLLFQGSTNSDFLLIDGRAEVSKDERRIDALWKPIIRTWFTGGRDDPRITVIKVTPTGGHYWDTKHGNAVAGIKMMIGAAIGKTLDDSVQGRLDVRRKRARRGRVSRGRASDG